MELMVVVAFSPLARIGDNVQAFIPRRHFFLFFFKAEISSYTLMPLFMPGLSTVAQQAEMSKAECSLTRKNKLVSR